MVLLGKVKPDTSRPDLLHPVSVTVLKCARADNLNTKLDFLEGVFVLQLNFVRFYLPLLDISHKRVIYLDDDVIVQGTYLIKGLCTLQITSCISHQKVL